MRIIHAYRNLWDTFQKITKGIPIAFNPTQFKINYDYNRQSGIFSTRDVPHLMLNGWPERASTGHTWNRLDICIQVNHRIKGERRGSREVEMILVESRVEVSYLRYVPDSMHEVNTLDVDVLEVVHYDLAQNTIGHPIFHAQFANDPINGALINRRYTNEISRLERLRIATPPMDLRAVLFGLVADHVSYKLADLAKSKVWKNVEQSLPSMPCDSIREQIDGRMKNTYWYPM